MDTKLHFPVCAQFIDTYYPTIDGVVRTVHNYADNINKDSYCCVVAPMQDKSYVDSFSYDVIRIDSIDLPVREYRIPMPDVSKSTKDFLTGKGFGLFHAHSPFALGRYALRMGRKLDIPVVCTFHSKYYDDVYTVTKSKLLAKSVTDSIVRFYDDVDSVWAVSNGTANTLLEYGYKGDIFVVDNGTDYSYPSDADAVRRASAEKFGIPQDRPVLLFVGHQIWQKNIKMMLDAAKLLRDRGRDYLLLIVGAGYAAPKIKEYAADLGFDENHLRFLGQISDIPTMKGVYLSAGMFFFPSIYDNSPLVVREAAAMGLPALLVRGSNAAENVEDGINGFLCDNDPVSAADRIEAAFSDSAALKAAGEGAKKTIGKPWTDIMPLVREKYNSLLR